MNTFEQLIFSTLVGLLCAGAGYLYGRVKQEVEDNKKVAGWRPPTEWTQPPDNDQFSALTYKGMPVILNDTKPNSWNPVDEVAIKKSVVDGAIMKNPTPQEIRQRRSDEAMKTYEEYNQTHEKEGGTYVL